MRASCPWALVLMLASACAATGDPGGGAAHLPVSGSGPFRPLAYDPAFSQLNAPFVLITPGVSLDDPFVLEWEEQLAIWVTTHRSNMTDIEHADALSLEQGFGPLFQAVVADQPWESDAVTEPSLIADDPVVPGGIWVLFYSGGGSLGWATAAAVTLGHNWTKAPGPALVANSAEEGHLLSSPAVVRIDDKVRVYYLARGAVWAVEASWDDVVAGRSTSWTRLDGDPTTPARDPMLRAPSWATALGRVTARAVRTPAGRWRHDLYFTAQLPTDAGVFAATTCGFASSFTGDRFATASAPILPLTASTRGPTEIPYRDGALLLYIERLGGSDAVAAALSP
jgi:hypothetical protein